jgi:peptidoglycan/LPS O-acetylase OafA/YrhL
MAAENGRLVQLDALRGIAALMIVVYHYTIKFQAHYYPESPLPFGFTPGRFGVQLFFIISGFVIFMTLNRTSHWKDFLISRFARLFPAYWVAVVLTFLAIAVFSLPGRETSLSVALVNLTMLQEWLNIRHVDGVYWTLTIELSFYIIMLILYSMKVLNKIELITAGWLGVIISAHFIEHLGFFQISEIIKTSFLLDCGNLFVAGIMFFRVHQTNNSLVPSGIIACALAVEFLLHTVNSGIMCSAIFITFFLVVRKNQFAIRILSLRPLVYFGMISYSLYLIHQNIGYIILRGFYQANISPALSISIVVLISVGIASAMNALVEKPARTAIRSYWKNISQKTT